MLTLAAVLALALQADPAGNRIEPFADAGPVATGIARHCNPDRRWCAHLLRSDHGNWVVRLDDGQGTGRHIILTGEWDEAEYRIWPHLVRSAEGSILFGVQRAASGGFSGGGWQASHLLLYRVRPDLPPDRQVEDGSVVLELPLSASASIRACFDDRDRRRRRDACSDEYSYEATIAVDPARVGAMPVLRISTAASTYPGRRSRTEDSSQSPPLRRQDLVHWPDPVCSYVRTYRFDVAAGHYEPDRPVPSCGDYLDFE